MNDQLDLTVSRIIEAPRSVVWKAWKEPEHFVKWWAPSPVLTISKKHAFFSGGGFDTDLRLEDGTLLECGEGCFVEVVENRRIVFTDALQGGWRPNEESFFSAIITLEDVLGGTLYTATALHKSEADCQKHAKMGFLDGWGTAIEQLEEVVKVLLHE